MTRELILVVDDNRQMAEFLAENILPELSYRALTAFGGKAAIQLIRERPQQLSLMLLDLEMPDEPEVLMGDANPDDVPLFDSSEDWVTATRKLKSRKRY